MKILKSFPFSPSRRLIFFFNKFDNHSSVELTMPAQQGAVKLINGRIW
jgi:hypothetical protein